MRSILTASISSKSTSANAHFKKTTTNSTNNSETTTTTAGDDNDDDNDDENLPDPNSYGFKALQRRFNDLSANKVEITGEDIRVALEKLKFPASRDSVLSFMNKITKKRKEHFEDCPTLTFREFQVYAVKRERELLKTFRQFDKQNLVYLTPWQVKRVLFARGRGTARAVRSPSVDEDAREAGNGRETDASERGRTRATSGTREAARARETRARGG